MKLLYQIVSSSVLLLLLLFNASVAQAIVDPHESANNKFGIHIIDENDLEDAAALVNGTGGSWGYVTIVIPENDRDTEKWQRTFDRMRRLKLIPIVRLATSPEGSSWRSPSPDDAQEWASFLNSLNWVVENRYVVLFNEPNHAKEWGGVIDPKGYANVAVSFRDALREASSDFFILPAGLDLAASNTRSTMEASAYYNQMAQAEPSLFSSIDGLATHSYPNPAFSGSVYATGKSSIRGYEWERSYLSQFGLSSDIPIFITETGWVHESGENTNEGYYSTEEVAQFYETAFTQVWTDKHIVMISPFVLSYQGKPFDHFSWKKFNTSEFHEQYHRVLGIAKENGQPSQLDSLEVKTDTIPAYLNTNSLYFLPVTIRNTGQKIWDSSNTLKLKAVGVVGESTPIIKSIPALEPNQETIVKIPFKTSSIETMMPIVFAVENESGEMVSDLTSTKISIQKPASAWGKLLHFLSKRANH